MLRAGFPPLQLLFLLGFITSLIMHGSATADVLVTVTGQRYDAVTILGVKGSNVQLRVGAGMLGVPLASVKEVQMAAPPEFARAQQAFAAKDYKNALALTLAITEKFKGLPLDWAQQATGMLGDIYIVMNDATNAETAYKEFQRLYPGGGSLQADVGMARVAVSKKEFDAARQKLQPIAEAALKEKNITRANGFAYSQTFLALGEIKEKEGNKSGALEEYLRTVTLFFHDPAAVSVAQDRANALIAEKVTVP